MTKKEIIEMNKDLLLVFQAFKDIRKILIKWNIGIEDALLIFRLKNFNAKWISFRFAPVILKRLSTIKERFNFTPIQKRILHDAIEFHNPQTYSLIKTKTDLKSKNIFTKILNSFN